MATRSPGSTPETAQFHHDAGGLVPQRQGRGLRPVSPVDVEVAAADARLPRIDGDVSGRRGKPLHFLQTDSPDTPIDGGFHDLGGAAGARERQRVRPAYANSFSITLPATSVRRNSRPWKRNVSRV